MQPQKKPQKVVEQQKLEKWRGDRVEASTQVETSSKGKFGARWAEGAHAAIPPSERRGNANS